MYNAHRGLVAAPNNRLTELLDQVRAEFDNQQNRTGEYEQQSKFASYARLVCTDRLCLWPSVVGVDVIERPTFISSLRGLPSSEAHQANFISLHRVRTMESRSGEWLANVDDLVAAQMQEMEMVRQKVYSLEQTQHAIKQRYSTTSGLMLDHSCCEETD